MGRVTKLFDRQFYEKFADNWDDKILRESLLEVLDKNSRCLDYGAGRGNVEQLDFRENVGFIAGVDPDPSVHENPFLHDAKVLCLQSQLIDYPDEDFDVVFSDNVLEHIEDPDRVFQEINRVLKPNGVFIAKTPNAMHYMPLIARNTPHWFHVAYNRMRGRATVDTFPTRYKANSKKRIEGLASMHGFVVEEIQLIEGRPEYLRLSWPTYPIGIAYERTVNAFEFLANCRCVLLLRLRKEAALDRNR